MKSRNDPGPGTRVLSYMARWDRTTAKHSKYELKYERSNLEYGTQFCGLPMTDSYRYKTTEEHAEIRRRGNGTPVVRASAAPRDTVARSEQG